MASQNQAMFLSRMSKFSGEGGLTWRVWIRRFEMQTEDITDEEKPKLLIMMLDGKALDVCAGLSAKARKSFEEIKNLLAERFAPKIDRVEAYALLQQARRLPGETIEDFSDRVQDLVSLAYPGDKDALDSVGKSQFICGLEDELLQRQLLDMEKSPFREVATKAVVLHRSHVTAARLSNKQPLAVLSAADIGLAVGDKEEGQTSQAANIQDQIEMLKGQVAALSSQRDQFRGQPGRCFHCGEVGHFRQECPRWRGCREGV